jgi:triosephosphate isomerase
MYAGLALNPPFFEIGPKAYLFGENALALAQCADEVSIRYGVQIIFTPQYVDIPLIASGTKHLLVFAQHIDFLPVGRGVGSVLPEAVKAAGAVGTLLNHAEKPLPMNVIEQTIQRADETGLATLVCAGTLADAERIAKMKPNGVLVESPELIGAGKRSEKDQAAIQKANQAVWKIDPAIRVLHGAGISNGQDVYEIIKLGAQATGSTSGIIKAADPFAMMDEMIRSVRQAWDETH